MSEIADMTFVEKDSPLVEDLRNHTPKQMAELRMLLDDGVVGRADSRRPGFYELDGAENVYYIFRHPSGHKVLLIGAWQKGSPAERESH